MQTHVGPGAITLFVLTGAAFLNYVGWNIYEGVVARDAIRIYKDKVGLNSRLERSGAGVDLSYRF